MAFLTKLLLGILISYLPVPPQTLPEVTIVADSDFEIAARYEALSFFDPSMTVVDLQQQKAQLQCLKNHPRSDPFTNCDAPRAFEPRVIDIAYEIVLKSLAEYERGGQAAYVAYILPEIRKSIERRCEIGPCMEVQALKE